MSKLAKGRLCVIHNNLCEASGQLERNEQRFVACVVSLINKDDEDFKPYKITIADMADKLEVSGCNLYKEVRDTGKKLMQKVMSLRALDGSGDEIMVAWLSSARYRATKGLIEFTIAPELKPYLLQLKKHFTMFPLRDVTRFRSRFTMPVYLMLKQYLSIGTRVFELDEFRKLLKIEKQFDQYGILKLRVISQAVKEINEKTSLNVDFEEIREGRKVNAIRFMMQSKPTKAMDTDLFEQQESASTTNLQFDAIMNEIKQAKETTTVAVEEQNKYPCPSCGQGYLIKRINGMTKQDFWGCSRFAKESPSSCKYSQEIDPAVDENVKKLKNEELVKTAQSLLDKEHDSYEVIEPFFKERLNNNIFEKNQFNKPLFG